MNNCFVLFALNKSNGKRIFDPSLCGVFLDKEIAKEAQNKLLESNQYIPFILEFPLSQTCNDWLSYAKKYIKNSVISKTYLKSNTDNVKIEYKVNRKKL